MRRAALFAATIPLLALVAPAQAGHPRHDRMESEADDIGNGFHRYYGSGYGGTEDGARERMPDVRDHYRDRRHGERGVDRAPPPPPPSSPSI